MKFDYIYVNARFIERPNRFIAMVEIDGEIHKAHVPNTGRLKELLIEGRKVLLSFHDDQKRKTKYELRFVEKDQIWISVDSQLPNKIVKEALENRELEVFSDYDKVNTEVGFGKSRIDIFLDSDKGKFIEIKGVNLELNSWGYFPDAPTSRGSKHLEELIVAKENGFDAAVVFLIQNPLIQGFSPNKITDPKFSKILIEAYYKGVEIYAYRADISPIGAVVKDRLPLILS
ncbi:MAG: DNA/RNA nuclease SfsA [Firmicutes bacterium]|jgi:sugar fermentation stimulation protein A|nr:DNA/RNA nuclease SfsA [Bacillota bacterium]